MNQHDAQLKYGQLKNRINKTEQSGFVGVAALIEKRKLKKELEEFIFRIEQLWGLELFEPCPFCGGYNIQLHYLQDDIYNLICVNVNCQANGPKFKGRDLAIAAWNTRVG